MPAWIQRKRMMSRQDKIRMMWETQQRRRNQEIVPVPQQQATQQRIFNLAAGVNTPAAAASAPAKKGCGCGMKF
jgi:hypothetical protein